MYHYSKKSWSQWCTSLLVVIALALSLFTMQVGSAFAAPCAGTPQDATGGPATCDVSIAAVITPGVLTLTNDAAATVIGTPFTLTGSAIVALFTFTSLVKDHRGVGLGWVLSAASAGITGAGTTLPLRFTSLDGTSTCANGSCTPTAFVPITLTTTATRFLTTSSAAHTTIVDGDYTNKINGAFTIPLGAPSGTYTGIISITLLNTF